MADEDPVYRIQSPFWWGGGSPKSLEGAQERTNPLNELHPGYIYPDLGIQPQPIAPSTSHLTQREEAPGDSILGRARQEIIQDTIRETPPHLWYRLPKEWRRLYPHLFRLPDPPAPPGYTPPNDDSEPIGQYDGGSETKTASGYNKEWKPYDPGPNFTPDKLDIAVAKAMGNDAPHYMKRFINPPLSKEEQDRKYIAEVLRRAGLDPEVV